MPVSDFLPFAIDLNANVESQSAFVSDPALGPGYSSGMVQSNRVNKLWRQSSFIAAGVARLVMQQLNQDVVDDGDLAGFTSDLTSAIGNIARNVGGGGGSGGIPEPPIDGNIYGRGNLAWSQVVPISGATMTGALILVSDPIVNLGAATKQYVDNSVLLKAPLDSPGFIGTPTAPLAVPGANNAQIASTAFVVRALSGITGVTSVTAGAGLTGGGFGSVTLAIANGGVTNTMYANSPPNTFKGNNQATAGAPVDMTVNQANTLLGGPFLKLTGGTTTGLISANVAVPGDLAANSPVLLTQNTYLSGTLGFNIYYGAAGWTHLNTTAVGIIYMNSTSGEMTFSIGPGGTTGTAVTLTTGMTITSGKAVFPNNRLFVTGSNNPSLTLLNYAGGPTVGMWNGSNNLYLGQLDSNTGSPVKGYLWFNSNGDASFDGVLLYLNSSDAFKYNAPNGGNARIWFQVSGTRIWSIGTVSDGTFHIADESLQTVRAVIYPSGEFRLWNVFTMAGSAGGSYFQIFDDGNSHLESNTAIWLNGNSGKTTYFGGDADAGSHWIYAASFVANSRFMTGWQVIPRTDNTGGVGDPDVAWAQMQCYWYIQKSARDKKQDIETAPEGALKQVEALRSVNYRWRQQPMLNPAKGRPEGPSKPHRGFIADEVAEVFGKDWGGYECIEGETGKQEGIAYNELVAVLWSAVQELSAKNTALEHRLSQIEGRV